MTPLFEGLDPTKGFSHEYSDKHVLCWQRDVGISFPLLGFLLGFKRLFHFKEETFVFEAVQENLREGCEARLVFPRFAVWLLKKHIRHKVKNEDALKIIDRLIPMIPVELSSSYNQGMAWENLEKPMLKCVLDMEDGSPEIQAYEAVMQAKWGCSTVSKILRRTVTLSQRGHRLEGYFHRSIPILIDQRSNSRQNSWKLCLKGEYIPYSYSCSCAEVAEFVFENTARAANNAARMVFSQRKLRDKMWDHFLQLLRNSERVY
ncbi:MAG: hypothetical protein OXQ96_07680 [Alphaproteobacteria bacterium]|nr:hypothetical protein [Alphaproteobacteria bacterium]